MRAVLIGVLCELLSPLAASADVTRVTVSSRTIVAGGQSFGATGAYESLTGRIEFSLDPADPHNAAIADLQYAPREADGRVHFSSDLYVLRPSDPSKGNGVLFFEIANRGRKGLLGRFSRGSGSNDPTEAADFGDGYLMKEGYTLVWVGWEFDIPKPLLRIDPPPAHYPAGLAIDPISADFMVSARAAEAFLIDDQGGRPPVPYPPADPRGQDDVMTVRSRYWDDGVVVPRARWQFVGDPSGNPKVQLEGGFEPGQYYRVTYRASAPVVAGVGLAAVLHEHVGRILGPWSRRCADSHHARWHQGPRATGECQDLFACRHPAWRGRVPADAHDGSAVEQPDATSQHHAGAASSHA